MSTTSNKFTFSKKAHTKKTKTIDKNKMSLLVLTTILLFSGIMIPLAYARSEPSSGNDTIFVEASLKEGITKVLDIGEKITGTIEVTNGDNNIIFKLYDPAGNLCLWLNVLQSSEFSWGPVDFGGEYWFLFDNLYDSSSNNTVNLEFQITSSVDSFPTTIILIIVAVLVATIVPLAILLRRRHRKSQLPPPN